MSNIWEFLLQTAEVTLTAAILLILKQLFQDKLSPRWQYGVWLILAGKLLLPAGIFGQYMSLNLAAYLEMAKYTVESQLTSQFADVYQITLPASGIPVLPGTPQSITDWMFAIYVVGVILFIAYYLWGYLRLKLILRKGWQAGTEFQEKLMQVCSRYHLSSCRTVVIDGIDSAFVCGLIRPVLVIPANQEETIDEKIIIHELMHKKYFDAWQNTFWCLMRCLHWCNPVLQVVFNRIGNDMESLCDQRVLERLRGEERRDYGRILLDMTNQKYARAMGTTSLSNGGTNIKRRIESIIRFKHYPKGMALASICICILLASPVFGGTSSRGLDADSMLDGTGQFELARARIMGCSTQAGAIDTYIKGLIYDKEIYLAASMPLDKQEQIEDIAVGNDLEPLYNQYYILNLTEIEEGVFDAYVLLCEDDYIDEEGELHIPVEAVPIRLYQDTRRWSVEMTGDSVRYKMSHEPEYGYQTQLPAFASYEQNFEQGTITLEEQKIWFVKPETTGTDEWAMFFPDYSMDSQANPDAEFERVRLRYRVTYKSNLTEDELKNITRVDLSVRALKKATDKPSWSEDAVHMMDTHGGHASGDGDAIISRSPEGDWDGTLELDFGTFDTYSELQDAEAYAVRVYLNRVPSEDIIIKREEGRR